MRISKKLLKRIIKEELSALAEGERMSLNPHHRPGAAWKGAADGQEQTYALKKLMGALNAMGTNITTSNLETIQGLLDHLKSAVGDRDVPLPNIKEQ